MAALKACPGWEPLPCEQFEVAFQALTQVCCTVKCNAVQWCSAVRFGAVCHGLCTCGAFLNLSSVPQSSADGSTLGKIRPHKTHTTRRHTLTRNPCILFVPGPAAAVDG